LIELRMVGRMTRRALVAGPLLVAGLWVWQGPDYALSGAVGIAMTLVNLWLSARIIGSVAERNPQLLMPAALATFALGLLLLTGIAFALQSLDVIFFPVTGLVLIASHLGLVLWEAAHGHRNADDLDKPLSSASKQLTSKEPKNAGL
jgi:hypothetical protein